MPELRDLATCRNIELCGVQGCLVLHLTQLWYVQTHMGKQRQKKHDVCKVKKTLFDGVDDEISQYDQNIKVQQQLGKIEKSRMSKSVRTEQQIRQLGHFFEQIGFNSEFVEEERIEKFKRDLLYREKFTGSNITRQLDVTSDDCDYDNEEEIDFARPDIHLFGPLISSEQELGALDQADISCSLSFFEEHHSADPNSVLDKDIRQLSLGLYPGIPTSIEDTSDYYLVKKFSRSTGSLWDPNNEPQYLDELHRRHYLTKTEPHKYVPVSRDTPAAAINDSSFMELSGVWWSHLARLCRSTTFVELPNAVYPNVIYLHLRKMTGMFGIYRPTVPGTGLQLRQAQIIAQLLDSITRRALEVDEAIRKGATKCPSPFRLLEFISDGLSDPDNFAQVSWKCEFLYFVTHLSCDCTLPESPVTRTALTKAIATVVSLFSPDYNLYPLALRLLQYAMPSNRSRIRLLKYLEEAAISGWLDNCEGLLCAIYHKFLLKSIEVGEMEAQCDQDRQFFSNSWDIAEVPLSSFVRSSDFELKDEEGISASDLQVSVPILRHVLLNSSTPYKAPGICSDILTLFRMAVLNRLQLRDGIQSAASIATCLSHIRSIMDEALPDLTQLHGAALHTADIVLDIKREVLILEQSYNKANSHTNEQKQNPTSDREMDSDSSGMSGLADYDF